MASDNYLYSHIDRLSRESLRFFEKNRHFSYSEIDEDTIKDIEDKVNIFYENYVSLNTLNKFTKEPIEKKLVLNAYFFLNQLKNGLQFSSTQKIIFIIKLIDPELKMLDMYYTCSNEQDLRREIRLVFGFYERNFINLEKVYNNYFNIIEDPFISNKNSKVRK